MLSTIAALRYSAARKQFSMKQGEPEVTILDYPLHQARLIPRFSGLLAG